MADAIAAGASAVPCRAAERGALRCRNPGGHARRGEPGPAGLGRSTTPQGEACVGLSWLGGTTALWAALLRFIERERLF